MKNVTKHVQLKKIKCQTDVYKQIFKVFYWLISDIFNMIFLYFVGATLYTLDYKLFCNITSGEVFNCHHFGQSACLSRVPLISPTTVQRRSTWCHLTALVIRTSVYAVSSVTRKRPARRRRACHVKPVTRDNSRIILTSASRVRPHRQVWTSFIVDVCLE